MSLDKAGYDKVYIIIDQLSKQAISMLCYRTITAEEIAQLYIKHIYRYYRSLESVVSDQGPQFISHFWKEFCQILEIKLKLSTAFYPQTDKQTEIMNQYLDQRLCLYVNYYQDNWSEMLLLIDYTQLTLLHSSIGMSSFQLINRQLLQTSFD
jgi:hypothetical protein